MGFNIFLLGASFPITIVGPEPVTHGVEWLGGRLEPSGGRGVVAAGPQISGTRPPSRKAQTT